MKKLIAVLLTLSLTGCDRIPIRRSQINAERIKPVVAEIEKNSVEKSGSPISENNALNNQIVQSENQIPVVIAVENKKSLILEIVKSPIIYCVIVIVYLLYRTHKQDNIITDNVVDLDRYRESENTNKLLIERLKQGNVNLLGQYRDLVTRFNDLEAQLTKAIEDLRRAEELLRQSNFSLT